MTLSQIHTCREKESFKSMLVGQERALAAAKGNSYLLPSGKARGR